MQVTTQLEQHEFTCQGCNYVWQITYEVRDVGRPGSDARQYRYLTGFAASSPLSGRRCPNCWEPTYSSHQLGGSAPALQRSRNRL